METDPRPVSDAAPSAVEVFAALPFFTPFLDRMPEKARDVVDRLSRTGHAEGEATPKAGGETAISELPIIYNAVRHLKPKRTLELGLAKGNSAVTILSALAAEGEIANPHVVVDPYQMSGYKGQALRNMEYAGFQGKFRFYERSSAVVLPELWQNGEQFDFIYDDAGHRFPETLLEWYFCDKMLPIGGVMAFDDCHFPSVQSVVNYAEINARYKIVRASQYTWFAIKTANDTSLFYDFKPFPIPNGHYYDQVLAKLRS